MFHVIEDRHSLNLNDVRLAKVTSVSDTGDHVIEIRTRSNPTENLYLPSKEPKDGKPARLWATLEAMARRAPFLVTVGGRYVVNALDVARLAVVDVKETGAAALEIRFLSAPKDVAYLESAAKAGEDPKDLRETMRTIERVAVVTS